MNRTDLQPAFILHSRPYRDTSALLEVLTLDQGRTGMVARGARAGKSRLRGILQPFQPLLVSWKGRGELGTMTTAEAAGPAFGLQGNALFSGFYINELLVRLTHRNDPHPELFPVYRDALHGLADQDDLESVLRRFELRLLESLGYGLLLDHDAETGAALAPDRTYDYQLERGPVAASADCPVGLAVSGKSLLAMSGDRFSDARVRKDAKRLMRAALDLYLGKTPLKTREVIRQLVSVA